MIVVTGTVLASPETLDEALALSLAHVRRSRREPGCISQRDVEEPLRLVFFEEWADREALAAHFAVPEVRDFSRAIAKLAAEKTTLHVYEAERTRV